MSPRCHHKQTRTAKPVSSRPIVRSSEKLGLAARPRALWIEMLEDRSVPAVVNWIGAVDGDWSNAANWFNTDTTTNIVPVNGDELVFDSGNLTGAAVATGLNNDLGALTSVLSIDFAAGAFTITTGNALTVTSDVTSTGAGDDLLGIVINGAANVDMSGSGDLELAASNGFTGLVNVNSGSLTVSANNALGTVVGDTTVDLGASLIFDAVTYATAESINLDGGTIATTAGTSTFTGDIALSTASGILDVDGVQLTLTGDIAGAFGLESNGTGIVELTGNNSFTGDVNVNAGTLRVANSSALGDATGATIVDTGATLDFAGVTYGILEEITLDGGTITASTGTSVFNGDITMTTADGTFDVDGTSLTLGGIIDGAFGLTKDGLGTLSLGGNNTFTGVVNVDAGILQVTADNALGTVAGGTNVATGATLDFAGVTYTPLEAVTLAGGTLSGSTGTSTFSGDITMTAAGLIDVDGTALTLDGVISGAFGINKSGTGMLVLDALNLYTGNTVIDAGTLQVATDGALGTIAGVTNVNAGGTLDFDNVAYATLEAISLNGGALSGSIGASSVAGDITLLADSIVDVDGTSLDIDGDISGGFGLQKTGLGLLILDGTNSFTGNMSVLAGTLGGGGTLTSDIDLVAGATVDPGLAAATGILTTTDSVHFVAGSTFAATINTATPGTGFDQLIANGVALDGATLSASGVFVGTDGAEIILISNTSGNAVSGTFIGLSEGSLVTVGGQLYRISYVGGDGNDVTLTATSGGTDTVGVFDPNTATWYLRDANNNDGPPDYVFQFGGRGMIGVTGDWDGDGVDTIGVFDPNTATWYLRNENNNDGPPDAIITYGFSSGIPVVGDWDGDGTDTIGIYNPTNATWYLRNSNSAGSPDEVFSYGFGAIPVVGNWDGVIGDGIGVYNAANATWYLRDTASAGSPDAGVFAYGFSGVKPVTGDWDFDGSDGIGVFSQNGTWYLRNEANAGSPDAGVFQYGGGSLTPVTGNWTGPITLLASGTPSGAGSSVTEDALAPIFAEALSRWGVTSDASFISLSIGDLPANTLAQAVGTSIVIDRDAAGHGWFLDSTPEDDSEFANGEGPQGMDLLTTIMHELGHVFGIEHSDEGDADLMARTLRSGVRQEPSAAEVDAFLSSDAFDLLFV